MTTYAEPPAVVAGQIMSATNWNDWVVDVAKAMWVYTTAGDLAYATAANAKARLAIGAAQSILYSSGSAPAWLAKGGGSAILTMNAGATALSWLTKGGASSILSMDSAGSALSWLTKGGASSILSMDSAGSALSWLAKGTANQVLGMNSGATALEWKSALVKGTRVVNASFSLADATLTQVSFTAESVDELGAWVIGSPTRLTIPTTGWYMVSAYTSYANNSSGRRLTSVILNGTTEVITTDYRMPVNGGTTNVTIAGLAYLTAADYLELQVYQTSGGSLTVTTSVVTIAKL